jgi:hypothetical protein
MFVTPEWKDGAPALMDAREPKEVVVHSSFRLEIATVAGPVGTPGGKLSPG